MNDKPISPDGKPASAPHPGHTASLRRILVVDDDLSIRQLNTEVLLDSGYHVDAAEDGAAAWDALQLNRYDLLVTDNHMPKMTGVDLLKKVHGARMALPVIMATGTVPEYEFARQPWIQPATTLLKPHTTAELVAAVSRVLSATGRTPEASASPARPAMPPISPWLNAMTSPKPEPACH